MDRDHFPRVRLRVVLVKVILAPVPSRFELGPDAIARPERFGAQDALANPRVISFKV